MANELILLIGIFLIFIGILLVMLYSFIEGTRESKVEAGGVVLIGPIPIIFGTSSWMTLAAALIGLILFLGSLFFLFRSY